MPKSKFLIILEEVLKNNYRDPIKLNQWLKRATEHIERLELEKDQPSKSSTTPIKPVEKIEDIFKREIEQTLLSTIAPEDWQIQTLIDALRVFVNWKDKKRKSVVSEYLTLIRKSIQRLRARKAEIEQEEVEGLADTFLGEDENE